MNYTWERRPHHFVRNKANYRLLLDGQPTGWWIEWCGHPTALRPYSLAREGLSIPLRTYRTVADAKSAVMDLVENPPDEAR